MFVPTIQHTPAICGGDHSQCCVCVSGGRLVHGCNSISHFFQARILHKYQMPLHFLPRLEIELINLKDQDLYIVSVYSFLAN